MEINKYIESGVLEAYVLGSASAEETRELLQLKQQYPEIQQALYELETDLECIAQNMAMIPPPGMLTKIEDSINALIPSPEVVVQMEKRDRSDSRSDTNKDNQFIEVESESNQMRIHKAWRWVFAAVFLLSKLFLIASIYYYLENRQAQEQIKELKTELKQYKTR